MSTIVKFEFASTWVLAVVSLPIMVTVAADTGAAKEIIAKLERMTAIGREGRVARASLRNRGNERQQWH